MGMTIEDATLYMELYKRKLFNSVSDLDKDIEAYDMVINIMRKYQKIEKIVNNTFKNIAKEDERYAYEWLGDIKGVLEDGNDD